MLHTCAGDASTTMFADMHRELTPVTWMSTGTSVFVDAVSPKACIVGNRSCCFGAEETRVGRRWDGTAVRVADGDMTSAVSESSAHSTMALLWTFAVLPRRPSRLGLDTCTTLTSRRCVCWPREEPLLWPAQSAEGLEAAPLLQRPS